MLIERRPCSFFSTNINTRIGTWTIASLSLSFSRPKRLVTCPTPDTHALGEISGARRFRHPPAAFETALAVCSPFQSQSSFRVASTNKNIKSLFCPQPRKIRAEQNMTKKNSRRAKKWSNQSKLNGGQNAEDLCSRKGQVHLYWFFFHSAAAAPLHLKNMPRAYIVLFFIYRWVRFYLLVSAKVDIYISILVSAVRISKYFDSLPMKGRQSHTLHSHSQRFSSMQHSTLFFLQLFAQYPLAKFNTHL